MKKSTTFLQIVAGAAAMLSTTYVFAAQQVTIPEGTVIELRMDTGLNSATTKVNDTFKASVLRSLSVDGRVAVPEGSVIDGRVTTVQPAERSSKSGVIGVEFTQLSINAKPYPIEGTLTSLRADERKQIIDEESRVQGRSSTPRNIIFIGGGAGAGAVIGAIAGGGRGAGIGAAAGGGLGVLGALLTRGSEADVAVGAEVAMQLVRSVNVNADQRPSRQSGSRERSLYTAAGMVRGAQTALRQQKYYDGASSGRLDEATRRAIAHYQIDNNQPVSGDLDEATVASLGLVRTGAGTPAAPADAHSPANATNRQAATDINRKSVALLTSYETRLGVRVDDIRAKPQLSEPDLDLLLQVQAFAKAANWYEQASKATGQTSEAAFDNFARILLRSAELVEHGMQTASQDRRFSDSWTGIQTSLRQIDLNERSTR